MRGAAIFGRYIKSRIDAILTGILPNSRTQHRAKKNVVNGSRENMTQIEKWNRKEWELAKSKEELIDWIHRLEDTVKLTTKNYRSFIREAARWQNWALKELDLPLEYPEENEIVFKNSFQMEELRQRLSNKM